MSSSVLGKATASGIFLYTEASVAYIAFVRLSNSNSPDNLDFKALRLLLISLFIDIRKKPLNSNLRILNLPFVSQYIQKNDVNSSIN